MVVALTRNTKIVNYFGLPAMSVPCGFTESGLPTAFQLIGRPLSEAMLLAPPIAIKSRLIGTNESWLLRPDEK